MSDLSAKYFVQTFKKLKGYEQTRLEDVEEGFESDKDVKHLIKLDLHN